MVRDGKGTASGNDWRRYREGLERGDGYGGGNASGASSGEGWGLGSGTPWGDGWASGKGNASGEQMRDRTGKDL